MEKDFTRGKFMIYDGRFDVAADFLNKLTKTKKIQIINSQFIYGADRILILLYLEDK